MVKRIGNIIGTPIEPTSTSASGCFRITAQQQRNVNVSFPIKNVRGDNPRDVSIIGGTYTVLQTNLGSYFPTGEVMVRFAAPDNWLDRKDYQAVLGLNNATSNYCANLATEPNSQFEETSYKVILTNHDTGQQASYSVNTTHTGNKIDLYRVTSNTSNLPRFESPLTFDHKSMRLSLRIFNPHRFPDHGLGQGLSGTYTAQVFPTSAEMGEYNPNDPLLNDPTASNYSNSALITNTINSVDILLVAGGGAGGRIYNIAANSNHRFGSGSGGGGGVLVGYNVPTNTATYNITVGQGGDPTGASAGVWNGTGSSAMGCYVPGGGHGAWMDYSYNSAGSNMLAAGNGGCGGGSVSRGGVSPAGKIAGRAGLSTISASSTMVVGGMYELYGFPGGRFPGHNNWISESNANANGLEAASANSITAYHLGFPNSYGWRKHTASYDNGNAGGIGGGAGAYGGSLEFSFDGCPGVYVSWATPDVAHMSAFSTPPVSSSTGLTIPQLDTVPYISYVANRWTGDENSDRNNSQRGYYGGSGSSEHQEGPGKGGGGIGQRMQTSGGLSITHFSATTANGFSIMHSADGIHGTGGGGGALYSDRNSNNTGALSPGDYLNGGRGGNGIVLVRIPRCQENRVTRTCDDQIRTTDGHYTIYVYRNNGKWIRFT